MHRWFDLKWIVVLLPVWLGLCAVAGPASAAESPPYELDAVLSLTGNCSTSTFDPVPDPGCPYSAPPGGPSARFTEARQVAVDAFGTEYVTSYADSDDSKGRVDVFDDEGRFLTEAAVPNAQSIAVDDKGNLYVFEDSGKVVRYPPSEYEPEAGKVQYANGPVTITIGSFAGAVAVDASNQHLYVAQGGSVKIYGSADEGNKLLASTETIGNGTNAIAVDGQRRRLYVSYCKDGAEECVIRVLQADAPFGTLEEIDGASTLEGSFTSPSGQMGIAIDEESGEVFIADIILSNRVYRFSETYELLSELFSPEFQANISLGIAVSNGKRSLGADACSYPTKPAPPPGDACNRHYLFVPVFKAAGRALAFHPSSESAPKIEGVSTTSIGETEATLRATIFPGGAETSYRFEITTQEVFEAQGFEGATVLGKGAIPSDAQATEVGTFATGLVPGEAYRIRSVAENGLGEVEEQGGFQTYSDALPGTECPNQALRLKLSAKLPDCRAYELVSPADTNGRPPRSVGFVGNLFTTLEASPSGDALWFKIEGGSLPGSSGIGSFEGDPYVATRGVSGWTSSLAGATGDEATVSIPGSTSPDQGYAFWSARIEGPLVVNGEETQYLRYPNGHSELIGRGSLGTDPKAEGKLITEAGTHVIFETVSGGPSLAIQLEPDAPSTGTRAVYDRTIDSGTGAEETQVVSLLPGNITPAGNATYRGASKDGEGIAFEIENSLYLRLNNETTYEIGEEVEFAGVSEGGKRVFYVEGGDLKAFDTASEEVIDFAATGDAVPVNVAEGGSRAYFVSASVLGGTNPQGDTPGPPAGGQGTLGTKGTGTLSAAKGEGTLESESPKVTGVTTSEGSFEAGMQITGTGIPADTTIKAVGAGTLTLSQLATQSGTVTLAAGSTKVTALTTSQGVLQVGRQISGIGIPAGTTIKAVAGSTLTLSNAATQPGVAVALTAGSTLVAGVSTSEGAFRVGMNITATGIPAGTIITAVDETAHTLILSNEASATGSQPLSAFAQNLYLSEEGQISFITTVTGRDVEGQPLGIDDGLGLWTVVGDQLAKDPSRTNPDGSVLLFQSRAEIAGFPASKSPQVYRYDSEADRLHCISCNPTGSATSGGASLQTYTFDPLALPPLSTSAFVPNLSPDGNRVFFESTEGLVSTDTDEAQDVYEWEENGVGSCEREGGCTYLISTGQSARDNFLYAHSRSGDDVFIATGDRLSGWDLSEASSIYDAKVEGGFPDPTDPGVCIADGCRPVVISPPPPLPSQSSAQGRSGNLSDEKSRACPKGKRKVKQNGKVRCVKKHKKHKGKGGKAKQRASANRGAGK